MTRHQPITDIATAINRATEALGALVDDGASMPRELDHRCVELLIAAEALRAEIPASTATSAARTAPKRHRKPSVATLVRRAEKAGRPVTSVTVDGDKVVLTFDEPESTDANNPWLAGIDEKATKQ